MGWEDNSKLIAIWLPTNTGVEHLQQNRDTKVNNARIWKQDNTKIVGFIDKK